MLRDGLHQQAWLRPMLLTPVLSQCLFLRQLQLWIWEEAFGILVDHTLPGGAVGKNPPTNVGDVTDVGSVPGSGRSPGVGNGYPLQYSRLENPVDRGARWVTVHGVAKSWTWLSMPRWWMKVESFFKTRICLNIWGTFCKRDSSGSFPSFSLPWDWTCRVGRCRAWTQRPECPLGMAHLGGSQTSSAGPQKGREYPSLEVSTQRRGYGIWPLNITWDCTRWTLKPLSTRRGRGFMFWKMPFKKSRNSNLHFHPEGKQEMS